MPPEITVTREAMKTILAEFGKEVDEDGFIVETGSREPVLNPRGEEVTLDELAAMADGSEIFIDNNFVSMMEYVESRR